MPPKKRTSEPKQQINISVKVGGEMMKKKRRATRKPRAPKKQGGIAEVGQTGTQYLGLQTLPPPQVPFYSPAQYYPSLPPAFQPKSPPPNIAGLLEDVKQERANLLEDIKRETQSAAIKQVQKAQGAEQRAELEKIGFQQPVAEANLLEKSMQPVDTFTSIKKGEPIIEEPPEEEPVFPFQDQPFLMIEDIKRAGRKAGIKNRPREEIKRTKEMEQMKKAEKESRRAEREAIIEERRKKREERAAAKLTELKQKGEEAVKAKTPKKSKLPTVDLEAKPTLPKSTQAQFNLI